MLYYVSSYPEHHQCDVYRRLATSFGISPPRERFAIYAGDRLRELLVLKALCAVGAVIATLAGPDT